jgi:D-alanyl-D-alanine carboxypeptidase
MLIRKYLLVSLIGIVVAGCGGGADEKGCIEDTECQASEYCDSDGTCQEGCRTEPDNCMEKECDPADHTCKEPAYCEELRGRLQEYVDWQIENDVVVYAGLIVGVDTPACGLSVFTTGLAVVDPETPMGSEHILPIASVSKSFLAATVLQLVEEGRLSLEDTLSNWRTDIPNADSIKVRQLLNHTSGIFPFMETNCWNIYMRAPEHVWTPEEMLLCIELMQPSFDPGTDWQYSNTNYVLLGLIVEAITGNELHVEIRNRILDPLGLDHTFFLWNEEIDGEMSRSYEYDQVEQTWLDITDGYHYSFCWAAGGIASSAGDLLAWIRQLMTGSVLTESSFLEMTNCLDADLEEINQDDWNFHGYGLGMMCSNHDLAGSVLGHPGDINTSVADMFYIPAWDSSVVVLINHSYDVSHVDYHEAIAGELINILYEYR